MIIQQDSREQPTPAKRIREQISLSGHTVVVSKLYFGDYVLFEYPKIAVERKAHIGEIAQNAVSGHERFRAELERMKCVGGKMYILIEQDRIDGKKIASLEDVILWENKHGSVQGERIYRILKSWENKYDIEYHFCKKADTGKRIIELLGARNE